MTIETSSLSPMNPSVRSLSTFKFKCVSSEFFTQSSMSSLDWRTTFKTPIWNATDFSIYSCLGGQSINFLVCARSSSMFPVDKCCIQRVFIPSRTFFTFWRTPVWKGLEISAISDNCSAWCRRVLAVEFTAAGRSLSNSSRSEAWRTVTCTALFISLPPIDVSYISFRRRFDEIIRVLHRVPEAFSARFFSSCLNRRIFSLLLEFQSVSVL